MPEPVIYMRGFSSPFDDAASVPTNSPMMADLKAVSALSDKEVAALCGRLSKVTGFLDPKTLATEIREVIKPEAAARSVLATVLNLEPKMAQRLVDVLADRGRKEEKFPLSAAELDRLGGILQNLLQPFPALARFEKAKRLSTLTGQQLESIELICDLRPIFDEDRKQIEGMMPYTRLHIVTTGADGFPKSFEAELTHQQVFDLREKAAKAESKLTVLRNSIQQWGAGGVPDLPLTRASRKKATDA